MIKNVVKSRDDIGTAYQLINEKTGKVVRNLVTHDRLKACDIDRESLSQRLPSTQQAEDKTPQVQAVEPKANKGVREPRPLRIVRVRYTRGNPEYLVRYSDSKNYWCDWVSKPLLENYKREQGMPRNIKRERRIMTRN